MKPSITSVQLAILETKQVRGQQLLRQADEINDEISRLLGMNDVEHERNWRHIQALFDGPMTPRALCERLRIEVAS